MTSSLEIDVGAFEQLVAYQIESGTDGIILFGTTGEGELLEEKEKAFLLQRANSLIKKKIPLFVSIGSPSTSHSIHMARSAKDGGADGILCSIPHFVRPSVKGCIAHFEALSKSDLPMILYHTPRCGQLFSFEELKPLIEIDPIIAVKECSGNLTLIKAIYNAFPQKKIFSGIDLSLLKEVDSGVQGSIGVIANLFPKEWKKILTTYGENKEEGIKLYDRFVPFMQAIYREINPQGIKCALFKAKWIQNYLRLPLLPVSLETEREIEMGMAHLFELLMCEV